MTSAAEQRIREHAYALWVAEGMNDGCEHENWLAAERAVLGEMQLAAAPARKPISAKPVAKKATAASKAPAEKAAKAKSSKAKTVNSKTVNSKTVNSKTVKAVAPATTARRNRSKLVEVAAAGIA